MDKLEMTKAEIIEMAVKDSEAREVLAELPYIPNSETVEGMNAKIYIDGFGRLAIYPEAGGWLGAKLENVEGDLAPFSD